MRAILCATLAFGLSLAGCTIGGPDEMYVRLDGASDPEHPTFLVSSKEDFSDGAYIVAVTVFSTNPNQDWDGPAWSIDTTEGGQHLHSITYGVIASGFYQDYAPQPLETGVAYELSIWSDGEFPEFYFMVVEEDGQKQVREVEAPEQP